MNKRWLKVWSSITGIALTIALILTFLPVQASINIDSILSIGIRSASANPDWLSGWSNRVKFTIESDQLTDANDLTWFPTLVHISAACGIGSAYDVSCIFDELGSDANCKKIAVTKSDGTTQLYVEIEKWDDANEQAWLWVSKTGWIIDSETDTDLYIYYDANHADNTDYVGDIGSTPAQNVWDANFVTVLHLAAFNIDAYKYADGVYTATSADSYSLVEPSIMPPYTNPSQSLWQMWCTSSLITYFTSSDGLSWTRVGLCTITSGVQGQCVLWDGTQYRLYAAYATGWPKTKIAYWTSSDGQTWAFASDVLSIGSGTYDDIGIYNPCVWKEDATHWYMFYDCLGTTQCDYWTALAHSSDGVSWTKDGTITLTGGFEKAGETSTGSRIGSSSVIKEDSTYYIAFLGEAPHSSLTDQYGTQVYVARSTNKLDWACYGGTVAASNPFIAKTKSWELGASIYPVNSDESQVADPCVLVYGNNLYIYYAGMYSQTPTSGHPHRIGLVKIPYSSSISEAFDVGSTVEDSTPNNVDLLYSAYPAGATGKDGIGAIFPGFYSSYRGSANTAVLNGVSSLTVEFWLYQTAYRSSYMYPLSKANVGVGGTSDFLFYFQDNGGSNHYMGFGVPSASTWYETWDTVTPSLDTWYKFTGVYDGAHITLYKNNVAVGTPVARTGNTQSITKPLWLGTSVPIGANRQLIGSMDEVRLSNIDRSATWIKAAYETERDNLLDWGSEETPTPEITNTPDSNDFGILQVNTTSNTAMDYFTITNTGNCAVDVTIQGTDATGGDDTWTLSNTATPGENIYGLYAGLDDADDLFDVIVREAAAYNTLVSDLAEDATQDWGLKIYMPTSLSGYDAQQMTGTITLVASAS